MSNVVRLFARGIETCLAEPQIRVLSALTEIREASGKLDRAVKGLSERFAAMEVAIDTIGDTKKRSKLRESAALNREALSEASLSLSEELETLLGAVARESVVGTSQT